MTVVQRFLVVHDYGMGGVWTWVRARSGEEILEACAEVEVVTDPEWLLRCEGQNDIDEVDLGSPPPGSIIDLCRARRDAYRHLPGYGALAGRERVYLGETWDEDGMLYLLELGSDARMLRQVTVDPADPGSGVRRDMSTWPINPPYDLHDPRFLAMEIPAAEFEAAWDRARPDPDDEP